MRQVYANKSSDDKCSKPGCRCSSREEKKTVLATAEAIKTLLYDNRRCGEGTESDCSHQKGYPVSPAYLLD